MVSDTFCGMLSFLQLVDSYFVSHFMQPMKCFYVYADLLSKLHPSFGERADIKLKLVQNYNSIPQVFSKAKQFNVYKLEAVFRYALCLSK